MGVVEDDNIIDPEVQFILQGGSEQIELLLEKVRGNIERAFQESPSMLIFFTFIILHLVMHD